MWVDMSRLIAPPDVKFFLVGNKGDLADERTVEISEALGLARRIGDATYLEMSAFSGAGIDNLKAELAELGSNNHHERAQIEDLERGASIKDVSCISSIGGKC
jgi:tRNA U34 5-carboxymethylaminomethyl modifying GTPase MnmE/TrmE